MMNKELLEQYVMGNKTVIFYVEFKKLYESFCNSLYYDYEKKYGYNKIDSEKERQKDCMMVLREIVYLVWKNLEQLDHFPKEELYLVLNCVRLARSEKIEDAIDLSQVEKYRQLEENYSR